MVISFNFSPTSNQLHPLQVENCNSNSRRVVDEDDNGKFRLERVNKRFVVFEGQCYLMIFCYKVFFSVVAPRRMPEIHDVHYDKPSSSKRIEDVDESIYQNSSINKNPPASQSSTGYTPFYCKPRILLITTIGVFNPLSPHDALKHHFTSL